MDELKKIDSCRATFNIQIQFEQNATWQGTIAWAEGDKLQRFRSELEMLKLMMEAVGDSQNNDFEDNLKTWK